MLVQILTDCLLVISRKKYQLKLRKLPRRVGDQILRLTVYDFDRLGKLSCDAACCLITA